MQLTTPMTFEQFEAFNAEIDEKINAAQRERREIREAFLSHSPFKPGQKVLVIHKDGNETDVCYIATVHPGYKKASFDGYNYTFYKADADGNWTGWDARIFQPVSITAL
jgi:hypothetical protein